MTNRETATIEVPRRVWGRLVAEADNRGVKLADLLELTVMTILRPPADPRDWIVPLVRAGWTDREISIRTGEDRITIARARRAAGLAPNRTRRTPHSDRASWGAESRSAS